MRWVLHVMLPQIGEPRHRGTVEDAMIRGPTDGHYVGRNYVSFLVESRHLLRLPKRADYHLRWQNHWLRIRSTNLLKENNLL